MIVVMFSSGAGSWEAARRARAAHPEELLVLLFSDVSGEDEDNYRFLVESAANVFDITLPAGWQDLVPTSDVTSPDDTKALREFAEEHIPNLVWLVEGRNIWQVFHDKRFLGNPRQANCSHLLKQKPAWEWLEQNAGPTEATVVVGIDWSEEHRLPAVRRGWAPYEVEAPLTEQPYVEKFDILEDPRMNHGIEPPRLYRYGFAHANCGGGCVRAGQGQFANLLEIMPDRYAMWERNEQEVRDYLGKDVAILRDRSKAGGGRAMTLREFRERVEAKQEDQIDRLDIGGCGCFVAEETSEPNPVL